MAGNSKIAIYGAIAANTLIAVSKFALNKVKNQRTKSIHLVMEMKSIFGALLLPF